MVILLYHRHGMVWLNFGAVKHINALKHINYIKNEEILLIHQMKIKIIILLYKKWTCDADEFNLNISNLNNGY